MSYLAVCLNPTLQKTLRFPNIIRDTVNRASFHRLDAGGKGVHVCRVLSQLGKQVTHLTQLGGALRPLFLSLCEKDGLDVQWVESSSPIRFCYTVIGGSDSSVTELVEEPESVEPGTEERLFEKFSALLTNKKFLIISGTKAAGFSDKIIPSMTALAKERGLTVILDIKGRDLMESLHCKPDIIKPNLYEFASTFAPDLVQDNDIIDDEKIVKRRIAEAALEICERFTCRIILTRGGKPVWAAEGKKFFEAPLHAESPVNSTGSGDAFTAGFASAMGDGADFAAAIAEGIRCGALNARCFKPGVIRE